MGVGTGLFNSRLASVLECGSLLPLWSAVACHRFSWGAACCPFCFDGGLPLPRLCLSGRWQADALRKHAMSALQKGERNSPGGEKEPERETSKWSAAPGTARWQVRAIVCGQECVCAF